MSSVHKLHCKTVYEKERAISAHVWLNDCSMTLIQKLTPKVLIIIHKVLKINVICHFLAQP